MQAITLTPEHRAAAPELAARLRAILTGLAALIAHAFLKDPLRVALIVPLWKRLTRAASRFDRLMARVTEGREQPRKSRPSAGSGSPPVNLPSRKAWLLVALRHHGAPYMYRLEQFLADPQTAELIASLPQAQRLLRPVCHMLGVTHPVLHKPRPRRSRPASPTPSSAPMPAANETRQHPAGYVLVGPPSPSPPDPPPRPLHETAPCPHVFWPWFPDKLRRG